MALAAGGGRKCVRSSAEAAGAVDMRLRAPAPPVVLLAPLVVPAVPAPPVAAAPVFSLEEQLQEQLRTPISIEDDSPASVAEEERVQGLRDHDVLRQITELQQQRGSLASQVASE